MDGGFADHPRLRFGWLQQSRERRRQHIQSPRVAAESRKDQAALVGHEALGADVVAALHDRSAGVQWPAISNSARFSFCGMCPQRDGTQLHFIHANAAQPVMGIGVMVAGNPDGVGARGYGAQALGILFAHFVMGHASWKLSPSRKRRRGTCGLQHILQHGQRCHRVIGRTCRPRRARLAPCSR